MMLLAPMLALVLTAGDDLPVAPPKLALPRNSENPQADVAWNLSLSEAIRLGLCNSPVVRVVTSGTAPAAAANMPLGYKELRASNVPRSTAGPNGLNLVVAPTDPNAPPESLRAALLAHVRSVEQQYWALAAAVVNQTARERAVEQAREIVAKEKKEVAESGGGRAGTPADIAEAEQQLENFQLNLVTATSDVVTTEKGLRNLLGLPVSDNRRIIPCSPALAAKFTPEWENSLAQMYAFQPEICAQRAALFAVALKEALILDRSPGNAAQFAPIQAERQRQQDQFKQVIHQTTHSLARFFLEISANFKQFETAQRLEAAATKRLKAQRAFYEEGRITIDRLLDAVSVQTNATAQAAQYQMSYNTSIAALGESTGTLLDTYGVTVVASVPDQPQSTPVAAGTSSNTATKVRVAVGGVKLIDVEVEKTSAPAPR